MCVISENAHHRRVRVQPKIDFLQRLIVRPFSGSRLSNRGPDISKNGRVESPSERRICTDVRLGADPVVVLGLAGVELYGMKSVLRFRASEEWQI